MTNQLGEGVTRYEEAVAMISAEEDERAKALLKMGLTTAICKAGMPPGTVPAEPFDAEFLLRVLRSMYDARETIRTILDGDLREVDPWE